MNPQDSTLKLSWTLPFAPKCIQSFQIMERPPETNRNPVVLTIEKVPQTCTALLPFDVFARIKNVSETPLKGEITVVKEGQAFLLLGKTDLRFEELPPKGEAVLKLCFVSMNQGYYQLPPFQFDITNGKSFQIDVASGVLIVGYGRIPPG
jgi:hypothetical protein